MADSKSIINRMVRAAKLDVNLYEEVEAEPGSLKQAFLVVIIVSVLGAIGTGISGIMEGQGILSFLWGFLAGVAGSLVGWLAWGFLTWLIGTKLLKGPQTSATWTEMLRTIGFAYSPGVFRIFSFIPFVGGIIAFAALIWTLIAGVIAVRQALDFSTGRAIGTCILGWLIYMAISFLIGLLLFGAKSLF